MTTEQAHQQPNITEQYFRETSEHFMQQLNKKDKVIEFLKSRLQEIDYQKYHIDKLKDKIKYALTLQGELINASNNSIYELLGEVSNRTQCINDATRSVNGDIEDFLENYVEIEELNSKVRKELTNKKMD